MREEFETHREAFFYGVGDRIYFDLYQGLLAERHDIPERVLMAFVQEVIRRYQTVPANVESTLRAKFADVFRDFFIDVNVPIDFSSMFATGTVMFSGEQKMHLEASEREWIARDPGNKISALAQDLAENPYAYVEGSFDRISIADFRDYAPPP